MFGKSIQDEYQQTSEFKEMKYLIVVEKTDTGYSAYSPDIDGCIATGGTKEEVEKNLKEAIEYHLEGLAIYNDNSTSLRRIPSSSA